MRRLGFLLVLAVGRVASAQNSLTVEFQNEAELVVGRADCDRSITLDWTASAGGLTPCTDLRLWVTDRTSCGDGPTGADRDLGSIPATELASGNRTFVLSDLTSIGSGVDGGTGCGTQDIEETFIGCGRMVLPQFLGAACGSNTTTVTNSSLPKLIYDAKAPPVPTLTSVVPIDGALVARVTATGDAVAVVLEVKETAAPDTAYVVATEFAAEAGTGRIQGLENGTSYSVRAYSEDLVANRSATSAVLSGTPVNSEGFYGNYLRQGGTEDGGCSAAGGGAVGSALLLLLGALIRRRR